MVSKATHSGSAGWVLSAVDRGLIWQHSVTLPLTLVVDGQTAHRAVLVGEDVGEMGLQVNGGEKGQGDVGTARRIRRMLG